MNNLLRTFAEYPVLIGGLTALLGKER